MVSKDVFSILNNLGLSESETKVYLAGLSLGSTSVQELAKKSRLSRTATYDTMKSLSKRGLFSQHQRGRKTVFVAENPDHAIEYFKRHIKQLNKDLTTLEDIIPNINVLSSSEQPVVRFYEGYDGILATFTDVRREKPKSIYEVSNLGAIETYLDPEILLKARKLVRLHKTTVKILHNGEQDFNSSSEFKKLPDDILKFTGDMWIYNNRVIFISYIGKIATVVIENAVFADTLKALFETAWKLLPDSKPKK